MKKKNILVIAPIVPQPSDIASIASTLFFLEPYCHLDFLDPLSMVDTNQDNDAYYLAWQQQMLTYSERYDAFMGFSFGGVILQQCFSLFEQLHHPIVLFSTPTVADCALHQKLGRVIDLLKQNRVESALSALYGPVFYPGRQPRQDWSKLNNNEAAQRLIAGLTCVLSTDSSNIVKTTHVDHLHLIGECSNLINTQNVHPPKTGQLLRVPQAGMRVLQDNLSFCKKVLLEYLFKK